MSPLSPPAVMDLLFNYNHFNRYSLEFVPYLYQQSFKMAMGGWMLGLIIFMIVCVILYIVKPFNKL